MRNPWLDLPSEPPFVLPSDESLLRRHQDWVESGRAAAQTRELHRIHLDLVPEPHLGDPSAPVVLLNKNPGVGVDDAATHANPAFRSLALLNAVHRSERWPFYLLDPSMER